MQTKKDLFNQALTAVGHAASVSDPEENQSAAALCRLWYAPARRMVLSSAHWPGARFVSRLARKAIRDENLDWQAADPWPGYVYSYALPADILRPQYIHDYSRFELGNDTTEQVLFSNCESPLLYYTRDVDNPGSWSPDLYNCVVFSLAAYINMAKSGKAQLTDKLERRVTELLATAATVEANSDDTYVDATPAHWAGTGFAIPTPQVRYYYPTQTYFVGGVV